HSERWVALWHIADLLWDTGRQAEARDAYHRVAALGDGLDPEIPHNQELLALFLATCRDPQFHNGRRAVEFAKKVVQHNPQRGVSGHSRGVADSGGGEGQLAIEALEKSMALRSGGDGTDWFFLAMAHSRQGSHDVARQWYDRAIAWMDNNQEVLRKN